MRRGNFGFAEERTGSLALHAFTIPRGFLAIPPKLSCHKTHPIDEANEYFRPLLEVLARGSEIYPPFGYGSFYML